MFNVGDRVKVTSDASPSETGWTGVIVGLNPGNGDDCEVLVDQNGLTVTYEWKSLMVEIPTDNNNPTITYIDDFIEMLDELKKEILEVRKTITNLN